MGGETLIFTVFQLIFKNGTISKNAKGKENFVF